MISFAPQSRKQAFRNGLEILLLTLSEFEQIKCFLLALKLSKTDVFLIILGGIKVNKLPENFENCDSYKDNLYKKTQAYGFKSALCIR